MMEFVNLTGHNINLPGRVIPGDKGMVARVRDEFGAFDPDGVCSLSHGDITGLPEPKSGVLYVVSLLVLGAATKKGRTDCVAPASGHPQAQKNMQGHILQVPGFVRLA